MKNRNFYSLLLFFLAYNFSSVTASAVKCVDVTRSRTPDIMLDPNNCNFTEIVNNFRALKIDINRLLLGGQEGETLLMRAAAKGTFQDVKKILAEGADFFMENAQGERAIDYTQKQKDKLQKQLIIGLLKREEEKKLVPNDEFKLNIAKMRESSRWLRQFAALQKAVEPQASVNDVIKESKAIGTYDWYVNKETKETAFMRVVRDGTFEQVKEAFDSGANFLVKDKKNKNALGRLRDQGAKVLFAKVDSVNFLVDKEEEFYQRGPYIYRLLQENIHDNSLKECLDSMPLYVHIFSSGLNQSIIYSLLFALQNKSYNSADFLIERGANINGILDESQNKTMLMLAVENDDVDMVKYLVEKGADLTLRDATGKTAYDIAVEEARERKTVKSKTMLAILLEKSLPEEDKEVVSEIFDIVKVVTSKQEEAKKDADHNDFDMLLEAVKKKDYDTIFLLLKQDFKNPFLSLEQRKSLLQETKDQDIKNWLRYCQAKIKSFLGQFKRNHSKEYFEQVCKDTVYPRFFGKNDKKEMSPFECLLLGALRFKNDHVVEKLLEHQLVRDTVVKGTAFEKRYHGIKDKWTEKQKKIIAKRVKKKQEKLRLAQEQLEVAERNYRVASVKEAIDLAEQERKRRINELEQAWQETSKNRQKSVAKAIKLAEEERRRRMQEIDQARVEAQEEELKSRDSARQRAIELAEQGRVEKLQSYHRTKEGRQFKKEMRALVLDIAAAAVNRSEKKQRFLSEVFAERAARSNNSDLVLSTPLTRYIKEKIQAGEGFFGDVLSDLKQLIIIKDQNFNAKDETGVSAQELLQRVGCHEGIITSMQYYSDNRPSELRKKLFRAAHTNNFPFVEELSDIMHRVYLRSSKVEIFDQDNPDMPYLGKPSFGRPYVSPQDAVINGKNEDGYCPYSVAVMEGNLDFVSALKDAFSKDICLAEVEPDGTTPNDKVLELAKHQKKKLEGPQEGTLNAQIEYMSQQDAMNRELQKTIKELQDQLEALQDSNLSLQGQVGQWQQYCKQLQRQHEQKEER